MEQVSTGSRDSTRAATECREVFDQMQGLVGQMRQEVLAAQACSAAQLEAGMKARNEELERREVSVMQREVREEELRKEFMKCSTEQRRMCVAMLRREEALSAVRAEAQRGDALRAEAWRAEALRADQGFAMAM